MGASGRGKEDLQMLNNTSIDIRFRRIDHSNKLIEIIEDEAYALRRRHPQVRCCAVVVEKQNQRHLKGNPIRAHVSLRIPGKVVFSSKMSDEPDESASAAAALFQAFSAAEHTLTTYLNRHKGMRQMHHRSWNDLDMEMTAR
jgi:ribosome-associated translation inhibitor RaiA